MSRQSSRDIPVISAPQRPMGSASVTRSLPVASAPSLIGPSVQPSTGRSVVQQQPIQRDVPLLQQQPIQRRSLATPRQEVPTEILVQQSVPRDVPAQEREFFTDVPLMASVRQSDFSQDLVTRCVNLGVSYDDGYELPFITLGASERDEQQYMIEFRVFTPSEILNMTNDDLRFVLLAIDGLDEPDQMFALSLVALADDCIPQRNLIAELGLNNRYNYDQLINIIDQGYISAFIHATSQAGKSVIGDTSQLEQIGREITAARQCVEAFMKTDQVNELQRVVSRHKNTKVADAINKYLSKVVTKPVVREVIEEVAQCRLPPRRRRQEEATIVAPDCPDISFNMCANPDLILCDIKRAKMALKRVGLYRS